MKRPCPFSQILFNNVHVGANEFFFLSEVVEKTIIIQCMVRTAATRHRACRGRRREAERSTSKAWLEERASATEQTVAQGIRRAVAGKRAHGPRAAALEDSAGSGHTEREPSSVARTFPRGLWRACRVARTRRRNRAANSWGERLVWLKMRSHHRQCCREVRQGPTEAPDGGAYGDGVSGCGKRTDSPQRGVLLAGARATGFLKVSAQGRQGQLSRQWLGSGRYNGGTSSLAPRARTLACGEENARPCL